MNKIILTALALSVLTLGPGCVPGDEIFDPADACNLGEGTAIVSGTWKISGEGRRTGCTDPRFDADELRIQSKALSISQDDGNLTLSSVIDGFALTGGQVRGTCVDFSTTEEAPERLDNLLFTWDGDVRDDGAITGTFSGEGPQGCQTAGSFSIVIN
jgi:hypothetical protein